MTPRRPLRERRVTPLSRLDLLRLARHGFALDRRTTYQDVRAEVVALMRTGDDAWSRLAARAVAEHDVNVNVRSEAVAIVDACEVARALADQRRRVHGMMGGNDAA